MRMGWGARGWGVLPVPVPVPVPGWGVPQHPMEVVPMDEVIAIVKVIAMVKVIAILPIPRTFAWLKSSNN